MNTSEIKIIHARKIYEMLALIKKRPDWYLTSKTISSLQDFLNGYQMWTLGNPDLYNPGEPDFDNFKYEILARDHQGGVGFPFSRVLLKECNGDESKAFDRFFELLEQFKIEESKDS